MKKQFERFAGIGLIIFVFILMGVVVIVGSLRDYGFQEDDEVCLREGITEATFNCWNKECTIKGIILEDGDYGCERECIEKTKECFDWRDKTRYEKKLDWCRENVEVPKK